MFFSGVHGLAVATGSTLLAALWPDHHLIIDRFALAAALVVDEEGWRRLTRGAVIVDDFLRNRWVKPEWSDYEWYAGRARDRSGIEVSLLEVERALYVLGGRAAKASDGTWDSFRREVRKHVAQG